jgi:uncharacterized protein with PQ loop repeat
MKIFNKMSLLGILATVGGTGMALGNGVQAYRIFTRKSASDLSGIAWSIIFLGSILWLLYCIEIQSLPLILAS